MEPCVSCIYLTYCICVNIFIMNRYISKSYTKSKNTIYRAGAAVVSAITSISEYHYSSCCVNPIQTRAGESSLKKWVTSKPLKLHVWPPNLGDFSLKLCENILKSSWWRVHQYLRYHGNKFWQPFFCNKLFSCRKGFISIFTNWIIVLLLIQ